MKKAGLKSRNTTRDNAPTKHHQQSSFQPHQHQQHEQCSENDDFRNQHFSPTSSNANRGTNAGYQKGANFQPMNGTAALVRSSTNAMRQRPQQPGAQGGGYSHAAPSPTHSQQAPNYPHGHGPSYYQPQQSQPLPHQKTAPQQNSGHSNGVGHPPTNGSRQKLHPNGNAEMALNQKNHRLAKELSDLRVRHREETRIVSRLTMENMNLASRCREAISQVAALRKELSVYQKRQSEWGTLQREVMLLRKQIDKNAISALEAKVATSSSPKANAASSGGNTNNSIDLQKEHSQEDYSGDTEKGGFTSLKERSNSPATDLDRIMSQQFRKQAVKVADSPASASLGSVALSIMTGPLQSIGKSNEKNEVATSIVNRSSFNSNTNNKQSFTNVSIGNPNKKLSSSSSNKPTFSNSKIPIHVDHTQKDDEFDADVDMVDFFAKSNVGLGGHNSSTSSSTESSLSSESPRLGNHPNQACKLTITSDEPMPGDVLSPSSPKNTKTPTLPGDNLLSSLDAFEASFASAFPETSFSIMSEAPLSSAKLDMSFDVPDFDPFFKSPTNKDVSSSSTSGDVGGSNNVHPGVHGGKSNGSKSQIQDLFPDSAMNFKSNPKMDIAFDSIPVAFGSMEVAGPPEAKKGSTLSPLAQLDATFSCVQVKGKSDFTLAESKDEKSDQNQQIANHQTHRPSPLSPQSMSAEIEQLDVIANLALSDHSESSTAANPTTCRTTREQRSVRRVKQPVSYAEPSTKNKLRRGDVLFPKMDAADKKAAQYFDLDRIMSQQ